MLGNYIHAHLNGVGDVNVSVVGTFWIESLGGDRDHQLVKAQLISYHPFFDEKLIFGARVGADFSFGDTPF